MYTVYFYNFDYTSQEVFNTKEEAKAYGISKGFEFTVVEVNTSRNSLN